MSKSISKAKLHVVRDTVSSRRRRKARVSTYRQPVSEETRRFDPLFDRKRSRVGNLPAYVGLALFVHAALFWGLTRFSDQADLTQKRKPEKVTVRMVPPKPAPIPQKVAPLPEPENAPKVEPIPVKKPVVASEKTQKPVKRVRKPVKQAVPDVPVDPVNISDAPPSPTPRRRVVGINFESTVSSGNGPAFAVGNTRMGTTDKKAVDGKKVAPVAGRAYRPGAKTPNGNQVAAAIPTAGVTLEKPKRLVRTEPEYPKLLKQQGIEGNVAVLIRIDVSGRVLSAKVIKGSGDAEFDEAAKAAAEKERFSPARRGDEAIPYTLKYTYRFRVNNK